MSSSARSLTSSITGSMIAASNRRLRIMLMAHASWIGFLCLLVAWWARLGLRQGERIAELEQALGIATAQSNWEKTQRMLLWESWAFFALLIVSGALLFGLYWRDLRRNRALQAFFASVTHELRTPLTSIRLQAESIAETLSSDASERELVARLLEDTQRLEGQVERTLELARLEGGGPVMLQTVQLKPVIDRQLTRWRHSQGDRIEVRSAIEDVSVEGDPVAIGVIVKNLLENAVRHAKKDRIRVELSASARNGRVELLYQDDGVGFSGDRKALGRVFHRGPGSSGSGIGLYLMRVLMRQMGGKAEFLTGTGQGFSARMSFRERRSDG